jgi:HEAT repeat protein
MIPLAARVVVLGLAFGALGAAPPQGEPVTETELRAAIGELGHLDYATRVTASRTVRRAPAPLAVHVLTEAATGHVDGYVRYRALVLLSGFNDPRARDIMEASLEDRNDRLRAVAYTYFEHHRDLTVVPRLLEALETETSEFVRPQLTRALAAYGADPRVQSSLVPLVDRGVDFFRAVTIEALGDYRATYAREAVDRVARLEGPLRDDAALALGKIGGNESLATLAELQRTASRLEQPAVAAGICLMGVSCASHESFIVESAKFGIENIGYQDLLRAAATALAAIAVADHPEAAATLFDLGVPARDPARAPIALAVGLIAIRNTPLVMQLLETRHDLDDAVLLLRDAFDMLEEDYAEERFFAAVRKTYWRAEDGSATRRVADTLIQRLEF